MIRLEDLTLFVRSAVLGSFSNAAREANLLPAQVSAAIKRLERDLNVRLFARSTRSLRLTAEGEQYLPYARDVLRTLKLGHEQLQQGEQELQGTVQIAAPSDLGRNVILPWLTAFRREHPRVNLRLQLSDQVTDVFRDPVDVALRYGGSDDASYIAMPLAAANRAVLVASPDYIDSHPPLLSPADIPQHNGLLYMIRGRLFDQWLFSRGNESQQVTARGGLICDDADVVRRWAVEGEGIAYKSWMDVASDVRQGRLQLLLPEWSGRSVPFNLVCPHRKQLSPVVRALYAYLKTRSEIVMEGLPGLSADQAAVTPASVIQSEPSG